MGTTFKSASALSGRLQYYSCTITQVHVTFRFAPNGGNTIHKRKVNLRAPALLIKPNAMSQHIMSPTLIMSVIWRN